MYCWNTNCSLCPWIIGVCRCSDELGEVGVVVMVGDDVGMGEGEHQSSDLTIRVGSHHCSDAADCVLAVAETVGGFGAVP